MDEQDAAELEELIASAKSATGDTLELDPTDPMPAAELFEQRYMANGLRTLHHHGGIFYEWNGRCYERADPRAIRGSVYTFLGSASHRKTNGDLVPFKPNRTRVSDVLDAVHAATNVPVSTRLPAWLADAAGAPPTAEIIACANGLLHLPTRNLRAATPAFFSLNALDFAFDEDAPPPTEWLRFMEALWPNDAKAIDTLQEWFGYVLTQDTRQQKILLVVGPKRGGKGTIARTLEALLGQFNVCNPVLASLAGDFGLAPMIGKQLAIIADARLGSGTNQSAIAERLLSISGEDGITIDRKHIEPWTGRLTIRFMLMTNELPRIADASGALASRFVVLSLQESFYGREDHGLGNRLLGELPGILNWAIEGWRRLQDRGRFEQPPSSMENIQMLEDLTSPIGAFLRERCEVGPGRTVSCSLLFTHWKIWCEDQGRDRPGPVNTFGRDLKANEPSVTRKQPRTPDGGREWCYEGIGLRADIPTGVNVRVQFAMESKREGQRYD